VNAPKVDFVSFVSSLAAGAAAALRQAEDLRSGKVQPQEESDGAGGTVPGKREEQVQGALAVARQLVDTLVMLEEKTRGNLSDAESEVIRTSLTSLRIAYVRAASPQN
jgi:hypothetical protein